MNDDANKLYLILVECMGYYTSKQAGKAVFSDLPKPEINADKPLSSKEGWYNQCFIFDDDCKLYSLSFGFVSDSYSKSPGRDASSSPSSTKLSVMDPDVSASVTPSGACSPDDPDAPGVGAGAAFLTLSSSSVLGSEGLVSVRRITPRVG